MKRVSLLLALGFLGLSTFAQYNIIPAEPTFEGTERIADQGSLHPQTQLTEKNKSAQDEGTVFWSEDFENGLPTGWELSDDSQDQIGGWILTDSCYGGAWTACPSSLIYGANAPEGNHFMSLPSDNYNCTYSNGAFAWDGEDNWVDATFKTAWIDVSNKDNILLKFATWFRNFPGAGHQAHFDVSFRTSLSGSWTPDPINVLIVNEEAVGTNDTPPVASGDDQVYYFKRDISHIVNGADSLQISFRIFDVSQYHASIDDIQLIEPVSNDIELVTPYACNFGAYTISAKNASGTTIFPYYNTHYTEVPYNVANQIHLGAYLRQNGVSATNATLTVKMDSMGVEDVHTYNSTTTVADFTASADTILLCDTTNNFANAPVFYSPNLDLDFFQSNNLMTDGISYVFKYEASSDDEDVDLENNTATLPYAQTYGRYSYHNQPDMGVNVPYAYTLGRYQAEADGDAIMSPFDFLTDETNSDFKIYGVRAYIVNTTNENFMTFNDQGEGVAVTPVIFVWNPQAGQGGAWEEITDIEPAEPYHTIVPEDMGKFLYLKFNEENVNEFPFSDFLNYKVGLKVYSFNGQKFSIGREDAQEYPQAGGTGTHLTSSTHYGIGTGGALLIDAYTKLEQFEHDKVSSGVSVEPIHVANDVKIYPNPTNGLVNIKNVEGATIEVYSITGNLIKTIKSNDVNVSINLSGLSKGTYLIKVINDTVITKKVNLVK